jgi:hypothetical protein
LGLPESGSIERGLDFAAITIAMQHASKSAATARCALARL